VSVHLLTALLAAVLAIWCARNRWGRWEHQRLAELAASASSSDGVVGLIGHQGQLARAASAAPGGGVVAAPAPTPVRAGAVGLPEARCGLLGARGQGALAVMAAVLGAGAGVLVGPRPVAIAFVYLAAVAGALVYLDVRLHRLPTCFLKPAYPITALAVVGDAALTGQWSAAGAAGLGALTLGGAYLIMCLLPGGPMGLGDVRLAGVLGAVLAWVSWSALLAGAFGAFVLACLIAVPGLMLRRRAAGSHLPFGPFMLLAAAAAVVLEL
jgi:prepilin signal peptidase PulO-like enzyme (type II secretory pathway)